MMKQTIKSALLLACLCLLPALNIQAQVERPRLVVGIVVDQMRWDYLYQYADHWKQGGFARLLSQGYSCNNTIIDYVPTVTACGHATVYTGTTPAIHGIAGNDYKIDGRHVSSVQDTTVRGVGSDGQVGQRSPRNLMATTLGDQIKLATGGLARVVGISLKDRAAILPAGHGADEAYWYAGDTHQFITSTYYMRELPSWVKDFNKKNKKDLAKDVWKDPVGVSLTFGMAQAVLKAEKLGRNTVPDMLAVSVSTTDAAAHTFGALSPEMTAIYERLDAELATFFRALDDAVGQGNYLLFLTADHGGTYSESHMVARHMHTGRFFDGRVKDAANAALQQKFGVAGLITDAMEYSFYLDNEAIERRHLDRQAVVDEALRVIGERPEVMWVVDCQHAAVAPIPAEIRERVIKGYHRKRSGDIFVMPVTGYYASWDGDQRGSNHGSWNQSDSHIPLLFYGWHVPHGETSRLTHMTDVAATVCAMMHIQAPDGCLGQPIDMP